MPTNVRVSKRGEQRHIVSAELPARLHARLVADAKREDRTLSAQVRRVLAAHYNTADA